MDNLLALPIGTELAGDYRIKQVLGAGGFGITYLAEETPLNRGVAIKEYFPSDFAAREGTTMVRSKSQGQDEDYRWGLDRFIEEAQALATFDHANIVRVYRYFRQNNTGYMVLKLEDGRSFKAWLDTLGRRPRQEEMDAIAAPLLDALELIHSRSFLHRDIAPDNIIIRPDNSPVLIDFGSARREVASHMRTMSVLVKPGYSPAEQYAQEGRRQGPWSDIYALAATLYHGVSGKRPADAPARMQTDELVPAVAAAVGNYRRGFLEAIDRALQMPIEARPQSIAEWRPMLLGELGINKRKAAARPEPAPKTKKGPSGTRKLEGDAPVPIRLKPRKPVPEPVPLAAAPVAAPPRPQPNANSGAIVIGPAVKPFSFAAALAPSAAIAGQVLGQALVHANDGAVKALHWLKEAMPRKVPELSPPPKRSSLLERLEQAQPEPTALPPAAPPVTKTVAPDKAPHAAVAAAAPAAKSPAAKPAPRPAAKVVKPTGRLLPSMRGLALRLLLISGFVAALVTIEYWGPGLGQLLPRSSVSGVTDLSLIRTMRGQSVPIEAMTVSSDATLIASAGSDGQIFIWDAASGVQLRAISSPGSQFTSLASSEHVLLAGKADGSISLWQMDTGEKLGDFEGHEGAVEAVTFLASSKQFATVGQDDKVRLWDAGRGVRSVWYDHGKSVLAVAYNAHAHLIATGSADHTVKLWDERRRRLIRSYEGHTEDVRAVALSPDGAMLASAGNDKTIVLWPTTGEEKLRTLTGHTNRVVSIAFSPDGRLLVSGSEDGTVRLWDVNSGELLNTYEGHVQAVRAVAFLPGGHRLASAGDDMTVRLWNARLAGYP